MRIFTAIAALLLLLVGTAFTQDKLPPQTLFTNVHVWDGTSDGITRRINVLVENNLIKKIRADASDAHAEAVVIDAPGKILMPGLIDSHVHFNLTGLFTTLAGGQAAAWDQIGAQAAANARDHLMDGFTTVRDTCGMGNGLQQLIDRGTVVGPRIYPSGACISPTSGHGEWRAHDQRYPNAEPSFLEKLSVIQLVDSPDEMTAATRRNLSHGASQIKLTAGGGVSSTLDPLYSVGFSVAEMRAAVVAAEFFDTYVLTHAYNDRTVRMSIEAGVKVIEHGQMVTEDTVKLMVDKGIYWSVNLAGMDPDLLTHPNFATGPVRAKVETFHEGSKDMVRLIKKHKPKIVFNVDTVLSTMHQARAQRDFEKFLFSEWFGNHALLVAMTSTPGEMARLTGKRNPYPDAKLGVIEEGAYADILIVDGNPLDDVTAIGANEKWFDAPPRDEGVETIRLIMKDGMIYKNTL